MVVETGNYGGPWHRSFGDVLSTETPPPPPDSRAFRPQSEFWKLSPEERRKERAKIDARERRDCVNASRLYRESPTASHRDALLEAIYRQTRSCNSPERAAKLVPLIENEPPEIFWPIFLSEWTSCDAAWRWQQKLIPILRRVRPCPREIYLEHAKDNGQFWSSLPDDLTLYRGCSRAHVNAISWTTNRSIAEGFAKGHRFIPVPDAAIATATIRKADIFAATDDRKESEIICLPCVVGIENWS
jgi:hypothetical protein